MKIVYYNTPKATEKVILFCCAKVVNWGSEG